jgi:hypothetical protein
MFTIYMAASRINYGVITEVFCDDIRHTLILGYNLFYIENLYIVLFFPIMRSKPSLMDLDSVRGMTPHRKYPISLPRETL